MAGRKANQRRRPAFSPPRGQWSGAHLEVVLDCLEVVHKEPLTVWKEEGQQEGQGTGDQ